MNPYESMVERRTELVFPEDATVLGTLFGGKAVAVDPQGKPTPIQG
jgi:acyl-CoA hydrolase